MSLYLGDIPIAGLSERTKYNAHHLLDFKWTDCIMNDVSWLRADTFSWQSGSVYVSAYNHLVADLQGTTAETETIGSYTITFYRATDGHKICLANQEQAIADTYNETGIAWYYIVDTDNTRFKLPRTKFGFEGLRSNVGDLIEQDVKLPNITGKFTGSYGTLMSGSGAFYNVSVAYHVTGADGGGNGIGFDASRSSSVYSGDGTDTKIQPPATQMYLYFYVGDFSQTATEQTAGLNSDLFNGKADVDLTNCTKPHIVETYVNGSSWYRVYSDGWCEQGGHYIHDNIEKDVTTTFLKEYIDTNYNLKITKELGSASFSAMDYAYMSAYVMNSKTTTSFKVRMTSANRLNGYDWQASGYIS